MTPSLTISLVAYNEERFIAETIESILNQSYSDYIFRIYDHGSTDSTGEIADRYAAIDKRIHVTHLNVNEGMRTHHRMIAEANTPFWMGAAGHDLYDSKFIEKCMQPLQKNPNIALAYTRAAFFRNGQLYGLIPGNFSTVGMDPYSRSMVVGYGLIYAYQSYGIYRLEKLKKIKRNTCVGYDHVLLAELALLGEFCEIPEVLFYMRQLDDFGSQDAYKQKHHTRDLQDGHVQFLRTMNAYIKITDHISDETDRDLMKMAYFTQTLIRNRNILDMYGCSIHSLFSNAGMQEIRSQLSEIVNLIEKRLLDVEIENTNVSNHESKIKNNFNANISPNDH